MTLYRDFNYSGINVLIQKFSAYLSLTVPTNHLGILLNAECGMEISRGPETAFEANSQLEHSSRNLCIQASSREIHSFAYYRVNRHQKWENSTKDSAFSKCTNKQERRRDEKLHIWHPYWSCAFWETWSQCFFISSHPVVQASMRRNHVTSGTSWEDLRITLLL